MKYLVKSNKKQFLTISLLNAILIRKNNERGGTLLSLSNDYEKSTVYLNNRFKQIVKINDIHAFQ